MDKKNWMQKWFMEYRENKRWCVDTSKESVSRLDVLKDKYAWTKPGFDMHPTINIPKKVVNKRRRTVVVTVNVVHKIDPTDVLYGKPLEWFEKRDVAMIKRLGVSNVVADSSMEGYYLCSDS